VSINSLRSITHAFPIVLTTFNPISLIAGSKELPPLDPDWYYVRAASVARKIYLNGGIGVGALARWYGSKKSCGNRPEHFRKASRGVIRHILIGLEKAKLVQQTEKGGRQITPEGQKELDTVARTVQ
jgi:small subunit ribosomal protein S19e